jgi:uroporphyrinogen-III synthase
LRLLVTRPQPDADHAAALLRARGHDVMLAPMLRVVAVAHPEFGEGPWSAILMTSANAARAVGAHPRIAEFFALPVFAVGDHTADAARAAGFKDIRASGGDGGDLARLVAARCPPGGDPLLYLAGEDRARDMAVALSEAKLRVEAVAVYRAEAARNLPPDVAAALSAGSLDGALHYSRRSAETFLQCATAAGLRDRALALAHYCLSEPVAAVLTAAGAGRTAIAARPQESALLSLPDAD